MKIVLTREKRWQFLSQKESIGSDLTKALAIVLGKSVGYISNHRKSLTMVCHEQSIGRDLTKALEIVLTREKRWQFLSQEESIGSNLTKALPIVLWEDIWQYF